MMEASERDRMGQTKYEALHNLDNDDDNQREVYVYPQGQKKQMVLRQKFQESAPFYLKQNKQVFTRRTDPLQYESVLAQARERFENGLKKDQDANQKNLEEYQQYIDETSKF